MPVSSPRAAPVWNARQACREDSTPETSPVRFSLMSGYNCSPSWSLQLNSLHKAAFESVIIWCRLMSDLHRLASTFAPCDLWLQPHSFKDAQAGSAEAAKCVDTSQCRCLLLQFLSLTKPRDCLHLRGNAVLNLLAKVAHKGVHVHGTWCDKSIEWSHGVSQAPDQEGRARQPANGVAAHSWLIQQALPSLQATFSDCIKISVLHSDLLNRFFPLRCL